MGYMDEMVCWEIKAMRTSRIKNIFHEAAGIGGREGAKNLAIVIKGSGEDYARKVLEFLEITRGEKRRKEEEEKYKTKWNVSARAFLPARKEEETDKNEGREEGEVI